MRSFTAFLMEVGRKPGPEYSLDRIDNDKGYEPGNIRWATWKQQQRNKRSNRLLTVHGETKTLIEWSEVSGIHYRTIISRINQQGWSAEEALSIPSDAHRKFKITDQNRIVKWKGQSKILADWARHLGFGYKTLSYRLDAGWPLDRAFTEPSQRQRTK